MQESTGVAASRPKNRTNRALVMLLPIPGRALKALRNGCGLRHYDMGAEGRGADSQMLWQQYRDCRASEPTDPPQTSVLWSNRANTVTIKCGSNNSNGTRWTTAAPGLRGETTARICFLLFIHGHGTHTHTHIHTAYKLSFVLRGKGWSDGWTYNLPGGIVATVVVICFGPFAVWFWDSDSSLLTLSSVASSGSVR